MPTGMNKRPVNLQYFHVLGFIKPKAEHIRLQWALVQNAHTFYHACAKQTNLNI